MDIRISDIRNFVHTTKYPTIVESAKVLGITQPSLSESIKRLELDLGSILFYRSKSGIKLTSFGKSFLIKANILLNNYTDLTLAQSKIPLRIGAHQTVASYIFSSMLYKIQSYQERLDIQFIHNHSRHIQKQVQDGDIDIGFIINAMPMPDLIIKHILTDRVCIWSSDNNSNKTNIIFADLELTQAQWIIKKSKLKNFNIVHSSSLEVIYNMVRDGQGLGILPERLVNHYSQGNKKNLKVVKESPFFKDELSIVYRPELRQNNYLREVISCLKDF